MIVALLVVVGLLAACSGTDLTGGISNEYIKIKKYKGLEIPKSQVGTTVTDEEVEMEVKARLQSSSSSTYEKKKDPIALGDMVKLDVDVIVDGKAVKDLAAKDTQINVGEDYLGYGQNFENALVGHKVGDKIKVTVQLPETAGEKYTGKEAEVQATIKSVEEVKQAEMTDEWLKANGDGAKTKEEYYANIKKYLQDLRDQSVKSAQRYEVIKALVKECEFVDSPVQTGETAAPESSTENKQAHNPKQEVEDLYNNYMQLYETEAKAANQSVEDYLKNMTGKEAGQVKKELKETCDSTIKERYALELICEKEQIALTDEEFNTEVEKVMKENYFTDKSAFLQTYGEDNVRKYILDNKTIDFLLDNAVEVDSAEEATTAAGTQAEGETKVDEPAKTENQSATTEAPKN